MLVAKHVLQRAAAGRILDRLQRIAQHACLTVPDFSHARYEILTTAADHAPRQLASARLFAACFMMTRSKLRVTMVVPGLAASQ